MISGEFEGDRAIFVIGLVFFFILAALFLIRLTLKDRTPLIPGDDGADDAADANGEVDIQGRADAADQFDVFLATPMAALGDNEAIGAHMDQIRKIASALRRGADVKRIFFAGWDVYQSQHFDTKKDSLIGNADAMAKSKSFVMILPSKMSSSVYVEAGMAISRQMPVLLAVRSRKDLPFLLEEADLAGGHGAVPPIKIIEFTTMTDLLEKLQMTAKDFLLK